MRLGRSRGQPLPKQSSLAVASGSPPMRSSAALVWLWQTQVASIERPSCAQRRLRSHCFRCYWRPCLLQAALPACREYAPPAVPKLWHYLHEDFRDMVFHGIVRSYRHPKDDSVLALSNTKSCSREEADLVICRGLARRMQCVVCGDTMLYSEARYSRYIYN